MGSSHRRKLRRYLLGATQKATRVWWIGQVTVRVMDVSRWYTTRPVREKAHYGAERSSLIKKSNGGLRGTGSVPRQTVDKSQSSRLINHMGRKHIWAQKALKALRVSAERVNKKFPTHFDEMSDRQLLRDKMRRHVFVKWLRHRQYAKRCGIPLVSCFHSSFRKFLAIETSWGSKYDDDSWDSLLAVLPRREPEATVARYSTPVMSPVVTKRGRGGMEYAHQTKRACRMCGYFGSGPHAWESCKLDRSGSYSGGPPRRGRGRGRAPRGRGGRNRN